MLERKVCRVSIQEGKKKRNRCAENFEIAYENWWKIVVEFNKNFNGKIKFALGNLKQLTIASIDHCCYKCR